ncbi:MAG: glycoside hydrolase family 2 protein [Peptostreptococcaceae bacterium]
MLKKILWNDKWLFKKEYNEDYKVKSMKEAENITLPYCYNANDGQDGNKMFRGKSFYQKSLNVTSEGLKDYMFLEIGAASLVSEVYVNGKLASSNNCGYSMYRVYLNPYINEGENLISIMVDNSEQELIYPIMADFSFYGGIYRDVALVVSKGIHFDLLDNGRDGIYLTQSKIDDDNYKLEIKGAICSVNSIYKTEVVLSLNDKNGICVAQKSIELQVKEKEAFKEIIKIEKPNLWQGILDPYLYKVVAQIKVNDCIMDEREIEFGFRTVEITPDKGVFLNGKHIKLKGIARHQDFGGVGNAVSKEQMELDMSIMKEIGANSVRLSHYQHDDYFYTLCDRGGFLTWAEIPFISVPIVKDPNNQNAKDQMERLIKQCYNHTSIYCWGVQNEITIASENEKVYKMVKELEKYAKELDNTRYTSQANIHNVADDSYLNKLTDLVGYNLYYGWYYKEIEDLQVRLDSFHKMNPNIPLMITEYGVDTNPKYHSYEPKVKDYTEEYQLLFTDNALRAFNEREYMLGGYVWNMFDFGSSHRDEGGVQGKNQKGLVTIDRKTKKDAFYLYKAYWSSEPFVKLAGSRFVNRHKKENNIVVLSNVKNLKLYLNGSLVSEIERELPMSTFENIDLELGENLILLKRYDEDNHEYIDEMVLNYKEEEDKNYIFVKKENTKHVINWFEKFDLSDAEEIVLQDGYYSTLDTIADLYENEKAKEVFEKYF